MLNPDQSNTVLLEDGGSFSAGPFCSVLEPCGAVAIGRYEGQYYAGSPAVTCRDVGQGQAFFVGATCARECHEAILQRVLERAGVRPCEWSSESVETVRLKGPDDRSLTFVLNHSAETVTLQVPAGSRDLLTGRECAVPLLLDGYGVALLAW